MLFTVLAWGSMKILKPETQDLDLQPFAVKTGLKNLALCKRAKPEEKLNILFGWLVRHPEDHKNIPSANSSLGCNNH